MNKLENTLVPSLLAGAIGAGVTYFMYPSAGVKIPFGPLELDPFIATGLAVGLGNMGGEILTQYVMPYIPKNQSFANLEEKVVPAITAGLATYGLAYVLTGGADLKTAMLIGGGSSVASKYVYGMLPGKM